MFKIFNLLPLPLPLVLISNQGAKVERAPFSFHVCNLFLSCNNGCSLSFLQLPDSTTQLRLFLKAPSLHRIQLHLQVGFSFS